MRPVATIVALGAVLLLAACDSDGDDPASVPGAGATGPSAVVGEKMESVTPAQIDEHPQGFVSSDVLYPVENAWRAGGGESFTEVDAGSVAANRKRGALVIFRHDFLTGGQTSNFVEVREAQGPLRITDAPKGPDVVEQAQDDGEIGFVGRDGTKGTLHLSDDSVTTSGG